MQSQTSALADFEEGDPISQDPPVDMNPIVGSFSNLQAMHPSGSGNGGSGPSSSSNNNNAVNNNNYWNPEDEEEEEEGDVMMEEDDA